MLLGLLTMHDYAAEGHGEDDFAELILDPWRVVDLTDSVHMPTHPVVLYVLRLTNG